MGNEERERGGMEEEREWAKKNWGGEEYRKKGSGKKIGEGEMEEETTENEEMGGEECRREYGE